MKRLAAAALLSPALALAAPEAAPPERALVKTVAVKAPAEEVWKTWTTREGITSFFAPDARVEARPGGPFEIHMNPYAKPGLRGADDMVFLALQPPTMLSFTWNAPPHLAEARRQRTSVVVRIAAAGDGTSTVRLTHSGWGDGGQWEQAYAYFDRAWGNVLANLVKRFDTGPVDWTDWLRQVKAYQDAEDAKAAAGKKP